MAKTVRKTQATSKVKKDSVKAKVKPKAAPKAKPKPSAPQAKAKSASAKKSLPVTNGKSAPLKPAGAKPAASAAKVQGKSALSKDLGQAKSKKQNPGTTAPARKAAKGAASPAPKKPVSRPASVLDLEVIAVSRAGSQPQRVLRPKFFPEMPTEKNFGHAQGTPPTPPAYGIDKLVLMPKDPEWLFTYWELTEDKKASAWEKRNKGRQYQEALKLSWESRDLFDPNFVFLPVEFKAGRWYLAIPGDASRSYRLELGWLGDDGKFISLLQSNPTEMPEKWSVTRERLLANGAVSAYTAKRTVKLGASEHAVIEDWRGVDQLENLSSGLFSSSSLALSHQPPAGQDSRAAAPSKSRIEVKGKLPAGSKVLVAGQEFLPDSFGKIKAVIETADPTLFLEIVSQDGKGQFYAYDLTALPY